MMFPSLQGKHFFLGIGAQKAGTSWLHSYLASHPEVFTPAVKEMHVFDLRYMGRENAEKVLARRLRRLVHGIEKGRPLVDHNYAAGMKAAEKLAMIADSKFYLQHFAERVREERVFGEITPSYALLPEAALTEIMALHPPMKFIFIMRDPIKRAWSQVNMVMNEAPAAEQVEKFLNHTAATDLFIRGNYALPVGNLDKLCRPQDVLFLFYETLFCDESAIEICKFLGIEYRPPDSKTVINAGSYKSGDMPMSDRIVEMYRPVYRFCRERFGAGVPASWTIAD